MHIERKDFAASRIQAVGDDLVAWSDHDSSNVTICIINLPKRQVRSPTIRIADIPSLYNTINNVY
jgi:hypothetical protein